MKTLREIRSEPTHPRFVEERDLHDRIRAGDRDAVLECLQRFGNVVYGSLLRLTGDREVTEDVTEQAFVALWRSPASFDPKRGPMVLQLLRAASSSLERPGATGEDVRCGARGRTSDSSCRRIRST